MRIIDSPSIPSIRYNSDAYPLAEKRRSHSYKKDTLHSPPKASPGYLSTLITSIYKCIFSPFTSIQSFFSKKPTPAATKPPKRHGRKSSVRRHRSSGSSSSGKSYSTKYPVGTPLAGIDRGGTNNCCFIAALEGAAHIPSWRAALSTIEVCADFFAAYDESFANLKPVPMRFAENVRLFLQHINPAGDWGRGGQKETTNILELLFHHVRDMDPALYPGLPVTRTALDGTIIVEQLPYIQLQRIDVEQDFALLFHEALLGPTETGRFEVAPPELLVNTAPFKYDYLDGGRPQKIKKNLTGDILNFHLQPNNIDYICDYFVMHSGELEYGHYTCARKINGEWYEINDDKVKKFNNLGSVETALRKATLIHYVQA